MTYDNFRLEITWVVVLSHVTCVVHHKVGRKGRVGDTKTLEVTDNKVRNTGTHG